MLGINSDRVSKSLLRKLFWAADQILRCNHMTLIDCNVKYFVVTDHL